MVDIHVVPVPGFETNLAEMLEALRHPLVTVHVAEYMTGDILEARLRGFSHGIHPFVSWVDGDDEVLAIDWVPRALQLLEDPTISAVYPRWKASGIDVGSETPIKDWHPDSHRWFNKMPLAHHLTIMRRSQVIPLLEEAKANCGPLIKSTERFLMSGLVRGGRLVALPDLAYHWKLRPGSGRTVQDSPEAIAWLRQRWAEDYRVAQRLAG